MVIDVGVHHCGEYWGAEPHGPYAAGACELDSSMFYNLSKGFVIYKTSTWRVSTSGLI